MMLLLGLLNGFLAIISWYRGNYMIGSILSLSMYVCLKTWEHGDE